MSEMCGGIKLKFCVQNLVLELSLGYMKAWIIPSFLFTLSRSYHISGG
jgi:hypothetical protein